MAGPRKTLYAPWREVYLRSMAGSEATPAGSTGCFLRDYWLAPEQDRENLVALRRTDEEAAAERERVCPGLEADGPMGGIVLLNLYPYANGHLLAALGEGRPRLMDYSPAQRWALWRLTEDALAIMERALEPQGVNIGVNQGRSAGAGVPQHVHVHLVPRWAGDVNFMTVVGEVRVIPSAPASMAERYRKAWEEIRAERER